MPRKRVYKMKIDTEKVIREVYQRPLLWNKKHELYRIREARDLAWLSVARDLINSFDDLPDEEKEDINKKIQQRWRTARDTYKKDKLQKYNKMSHRVTGPGIKVEKKKYAFFDMLTFLDGVKSEPMEESLVRSDSDECILQEFCEDLDEDSGSQTQPMTELYLPSPPPIKRDRPNEPLEFEIQPIENVKTNNLELDSDDLAFFQSLQPTLKTFSNYQKMMFRTKILQVIMEIDHPGIPSK